MNITKRISTVVLPATLLLGGCDLIGGLFAKDPDIQFADYGEHYASKPDLSQVEYQFPLSAEQRALITPRYLASLTQEQVDQIYARLTAGPIPDGPFDGDLFFPKGESGRTRISEIVGGERGRLKGLFANLAVKKLDLMGEILWKGKVFYRDDGVLRNRIEDLAILTPLVDGHPLKIPKIDVAGHDAWLLFPAKLYCGQSLLDGRRESIIIDYAFTDEIDGYREKPDGLAGRNNMLIRDEIRMVRPGLYLGRAYISRIFALNFVLYNEDIDERENDGFLKTGVADESCWTGTQARTVVASQ
jgi:hypothetical protein